MKRTLHIYHRSGKACGGFDHPQANTEEEPLYSPGVINPETDKPKPPQEKPKPTPPDDGKLLPPGVE